MNLTISKKYIKPHFHQFIKDFKQFKKGECVRAESYAVGNESGSFESLKEYVTKIKIPLSVLKDVNHDDVFLISDSSFNVIGFLIKSKNKIFWNNE